MNMHLMSPFSSFPTYTGVACAFQSYWQVRWILIGDPDYLERFCLSYAASDGMRYLLAWTSLPLKQLIKYMLVMSYWSWNGDRRSQEKMMPRNEELLLHDVYIQLIVFVCTLMTHFLCKRRMVFRVKVMSDHNDEKLEHGWDGDR